MTWRFKNKATLRPARVARKSQDKDGRREECLMEFGREQRGGWQHYEKTADEADDRSAAEPATRGPASRLCKFH